VQQLSAQLSLAKAAAEHSDAALSTVQAQLSSAEARSTDLLVFAEGATRVRTAAFIKIRDLQAAAKAAQLNAEEQAGRASGDGAGSC